MERIRKAMAGDNDLFPQLAPLQPKSKGSPTEATSATSSSSSSTLVGGAQPLAKTKSHHIVISDSEDDGPNNSQPTTKPSSAVKPASNPTNPQAAYQSEALDFKGIDQAYDPRMTTAQTQKALEELVAGVYGGDTEYKYDPEDVIVDGFQEGIELLPHQVIGRSWMAARESGKKYGGILADDMGLGKTIQTLTRIVDGPPAKADIKAGFSKATLVVCPVAVVSQWVSEIKKMTRLRVVEHHGPNRTTDPSVLERANVVVTSYSVLSSEHGSYDPPSKAEGTTKKKKKQTTLTESEDDSDDSSIGRTLQKKKASKVKDALFRLKWWRVVLDEAHNIKNRNTKAAIACCALDAKYRWCLTGTPMQNSVEELFSLIKFLRLPPLNDWPTFREQIAQPIKNDRPTRAMKRIQVVLKAAMLRRTKNTVLDGKPLLNLPARIVEQVHCEFDKSERAFYGTVEERVRESMAKLRGEANAYTSILVLLLRMRQACNHPSLVVQDYKKDKEAIDPKASKDNDEDLADDLADVFGGLGLGGKVKHCLLCQAELTAENKGEGDNCADCEELVQKSRRKSAPGTDLPPDSAKTREVLSLLEQIEERSDGEEKTIIFSQFTSMLDLLEPFLKDRGIRFVRYDGSMNKVKRDESLERIRSSKSTKVILISFKAGSTGLNLTCCNNVILVDMWWNPALEDQAFDRAHRLGQTKPVHIYKLSVPNTVEERILELQEKKRALANAALSGDKLKNMRLGMADLIALFGSNGGHDDED